MDLDAFLRDKTPSNFLRLVRDNIVVPVLGVPHSSKDAHFELAHFADNGTLAWRSDGKACAVYKLKKASASGPNSLNGYLCGYQAGIPADGTVGSARVRISGAHGYMFTPTMNGCTFVVGSPREDGARLVAHFNLQKHNASEMAIEEMDECARGVFEGDGSTSHLRHGLYRGARGDTTNLLQSMTFGVRINDEWRIYYQIYSSDCTKQYGVFRLA